MATKRKKTGFMGGDAWEVTDLGSPIHTALRKCCDSTLSSMAHALIGGSDDAWLLFLRALTKAIKQDGRVSTSSRAEMTCSMVKWLHSRDFYTVLTPDEWQESARKDPCFRSRYHALCLTFLLLADAGELEASLMFLFDE